MAWSYNRTTGEFRRPDGSLFTTIHRESNEELCHYLGMVPVDGDPRPLPIDEITVDEPTSTVTWPRISRSWVIVAEEDAPNIALAIQQLMTITGWQQPRAIAFAKWLRRFIREVA